MTFTPFQFGLATKVSLALIFVVGLGACGNSSSVNGETGDGSPPPVIITPPAPPPAVRIEDSFGARFGAIFRSPADGEPVDPVQADISIPNDPTLEPLKLRP